MIEDRIEYALDPYTVEKNLNSQYNDVKCFVVAEEYQFSKTKIILQFKGSVNESAWMDMKKYGYSLDGRYHGDCVFVPEKDVMMTDWFKSRFKGVDVDENDFDTVYEKKTGCFYLDVNCKIPTNIFTEDNLRYNHVMFGSISNPFEVILKYKGREWFPYIRYNIGDLQIRR